MKRRITTSRLVDFLKGKHQEADGFLNRVKIAYRPLICPFDDLLSEIPEQSEIFDIGCGSGMFLSLANQFASPHSLSGVEIDPVLVNNAKGILQSDGVKSIELSVYDGLNFPDSLSKANQVFMIDVLHHVPKELQSKFLSSIHQKMAPGAQLVIKDIDGSSILSYWNKLHDLLLAGEIGTEPKPLILSKQMKDLGFEVSEIAYRRMYLYPHFTIRCIKLP